MTSACYTIIYGYLHVCHIVTFAPLSCFRIRNESWNNCLIAFTGYRKPYKVELQGIGMRGPLCTAIASLHDPVYASPRIHTDLCTPVPNYTPFFTLPHTYPFYIQICGIILSQLVTNQVHKMSLIFFPGYVTDAVQVNVSFGST